jgi:hypothetical protein
MLQALVVFIGTQLAFAVRQFAALNVAFVILWLIVVALIYREHKAISSQKNEPVTVQS